jgi:hypothetical protein
VGSSLSPVTSSQTLSVCWSSLSMGPGAQLASSGLLFWPKDGALNVLSALGADTTLSSQTRVVAQSCLGRWGLGPVEVLRQVPQT